MVPYIVLFCILVISAFLETNNISFSKVGNKSYKILRKSGNVIIPVIIILILGVFRETTMGYDSEEYYIYYWSRVDEYTWLDLFRDFTKDNGFFLVLKIIAIFTDDYWLARAILFAITFFLFYIVIRDECSYPVTSLIIFFGLANINLMFSIIRQALAGAISFYAYKKIRCGEWIKCLFIILLAVTMHKSALICLYMLVLHFIHAKKFSGTKLTLFSIATYFLLVSAIPFVSGVYNGGLYQDVIIHGEGLGMLVFYILIFVISAYLMRVTDSNDDDELKFLFNLSTGAIFVQVGALQWSLLSRIGSFFSVYWCLLIPKLIYKLPQKQRILYVIFILVLFGFMFFYSLGDVYTYIWHKF